MALSTNLKKLLLIRDQEWTLVSRMFAFEFFQGASVALFFTSAFSLFIDFLQRNALPMSELAKVFIFSSFLLWFFGWVYGKLEHILSVRQITLSVLLFNALSIIVFRLLVSENHDGWFYYIMLAWFNLVYLLNNLEFWGLVSRLFDVRQSRRLFAIVSAGDIPAKFLGYIAAVVAIPLIGSHELLWIAAGSSLISLLFFHQLISLDAFQTELNASNIPHKQNTHAADKGLYNLISGNKLIRQVAFISFFTLCCYLIVNFVFYGYVKEEFEDDRSLAVFIAWFLAASRASTLILKLLFTNRISDRYGIKRSLLITPVVLLVVCILSFMPSLFGSSSHITFYLFGVMAIITDVLRSAIQSPVLLSTMQPLPLHKRLQGHTVMKGIMDPFAFLGVGVLLLLISHFSHTLDFRILSGVILVMLVFWIVWIFSADKNYIETLTSAIRNRTLNEREILVTDVESLHILQEKIKGGDEGEAVFVLHLIKDQPLQSRNELILHGLMHKSVLVRKEAVRLITKLPSAEASARLHQLLADESDAGVKSEAIQMLSSVNEVVDFTSFLADEDPWIASTAIKGIVAGGNLIYRKEAMQKLKELCIASDFESRRFAALTIGEIYDESLQPLLIRLLGDSNSEVIQEAIVASCKSRDPHTASEVLKIFHENSRGIFFRALEKAGESAVPVIAQFVRSNQPSELVRKLLTLLGKIGGEDARIVLDELVDELPVHHHVILHALYQSGFHTSEKNRRKYENLVHNYLNAAVQIAFKINFLQSEIQDSIVMNALYLELSALRDSIIETFILLYDSTRMQRAMAGLKMNTRENLSNALELIDLTAAKQFSEPFICLYENSKMSNKKEDLTKHFGEPYLSIQIIRNDILRDKSHDYFPWTKACVIYDIIKSKSAIDTVLISPLQYSSSALLRETAELALSGIEGISYGQQNVPN